MLRDECRDGRCLLRRVQTTRAVELSATRRDTARFCIRLGGLSHFETSAPDTHRRAISGFRVTVTRGRLGHGRTRTVDHLAQIQCRGTVKQNGVNIVSVKRGDVEVFNNRADIAVIRARRRLLGFHRARLCRGLGFALFLRRVHLCPPLWK
jgi:hypothetical protein